MFKNCKSSGMKDYAVLLAINVISLHYFGKKEAAKPPG
ncbi:hypothetical protein CEV32_3021 [Brucella rhizosphaerae]|uniref:Uncharacterized protein n=1 Tax=Brucella rhizosphaerae TaxID=571254 RepID=A0A256F091_9HYPH|nr:hypothetical protein CEV32_3021 [Brucella rhizosphaerae]